MDEIKRQDDSSFKFEGTFAFSYKTPADHIRGFLSRPLTLVATFATVFGGVWTIYEASISSFDVSPNRLIPYLGFFAVSMGTAIVVRLLQYLDETPEGLEQVNNVARRIAHLQRPLWEFRFAKSVLAEKLSPIDRECRDLLEGKVFVYAEQPESLQHYVSVISERQSNLTKLLQIAAQVVVHDFMNAIRSTRVQPSSPKGIIDAIETIALLYRETVEMERRTHSILPPERFEELHRLQFGWATPIRDGIHQLFEFLQMLCDIDEQKLTDLSFAVEFSAPPNLEEFNAELDRVRRLLPSMLADE